jgi:hypothetical protein
MEEGEAWDGKSVCLQGEKEWRNLRGTRGKDWDGWVGPFTKEGLISLRERQICRREGGGSGREGGRANTKKKKAVKGGKIFPPTLPVLPFRIA